MARYFEKLKIKNPMYKYIEWMEINEKYCAVEMRDLHS